MITTLVGLEHAQCAIITCDDLAIGDLLVIVVAGVAGGSVRQIGAVIGGQPADAAVTLLKVTVVPIHFQLVCNKQKMWLKFYITLLQSLV